MKKVTKQKTEKVRRLPKFVADKIIERTCLLIDSNGEPWWIDFDRRTFEKAK